MLNKLIIFIKNPILGTVKTRLAVAIGDEMALKVYNRLLEKSRNETQAVLAERHLFYSKEIKNDNWSSNYFKKHLQVEGDLGEKMRTAFETVIEPNSKTIIIGSDCFDLTSEIIDEAFEALDKNDLVIGPANDGGYYLLGMKKLTPELFESVAWSTDAVLSETLKRAKELELKVKCLQELIDIDNIDDLKKSGYSPKIEKIND
ncbi:MAG: TIGR04282 family arsenosugar biosynthesis glycosyltransferase [Vicingaceae bacterium]